MANNAFLLLPTTPAENPDLAGSFLKGQQIRAQANKNALQQQQNAMQSEDRLYKKMAPDVIAWDAKWERTLEESGGDREKALAKIQPEWEAYVPTAKEKGYPVTDTFDPDETKAALKMLRLNKIVGSRGDNLSQTNVVGPNGELYAWNKSEGTYVPAKVEGGVKLKPRQRPSKPSQGEKNRALLRQEANKLFPDANFTEGEILMAEKNTQSTGRSLEYELRKILKRRSPAAEPKKAEKPEKGLWETIKEKWSSPSEKKAQPAAEQPPKGAVDTGRTSGGKPVWELPTKPGEKKKYWIQSQAAPVNLAMKAEDVPLGTGMADQTKNLFSLQKQYQDALKNDNFDEAERIKRQMQQIKNSRRNVG